jgi:hypothetical protein
MRDQLAIVDKRVRDVVRNDPVCRRLMTTPGVGPVVALTYRAAVDEPERFSSSKSVGASFGLTPRRYQSGETDRVGAISRAGDASVRVALFEAAHVMLTRSAKWSSLKAWAVKLAQRRGLKRAKVALARKLAVILHRMWLDQKDFQFTATSAVVCAVGPASFRQSYICAAHGSSKFAAQPGHVLGATRQTSENCSVDNFRSIQRRAVQPSCSGRATLLMQRHKFRAAAFSRLSSRARHIFGALPVGYYFHKLM